MSVKETQNRGHDEKTLIVTLFGAPAFECVKEGPARINGRKNMALLSFLVAQPGTRHARDRLVDLFWPLAASGSGRASLRQSLSVLRGALGEQAGALLESDRDSVCLVARGLVSDVMQVEALAASPDKLPQGWTSPRGQFLEGLSGLTPDFDNWRATEEMRLSRLISDLLRSAADRAENARRLDEAAGFLTRVLDRDPLDETTLRRLMRLRMAQKRPDIALGLYNEMEQRLKAELEALPEAETRELVREVRSRRLARAQPGAQAPEPRTTPDEGTERSRNLFPAANRDRPSVAVLPFENLSGDADQDYFADGVTEDIIAELSRFRNLLVIAPNSSFAFRRDGASLVNIADALRVRFLLQGSLRRSAQQIMVTARLIDTETGENVWSDRYRREIQDIFLLQEEITRSVVGALAPQIELAEMARAKRLPSVAVSAYDLALKAQAILYDAFRKGDADLFGKALEMAKASLDRDPTMMNALWVDAFGSLEGYVYHWSEAPQELLSRAGRAAERLLELDSSDPRGYTARALVSAYGGSRRDALADHHYAFELNPNFTTNIFCMAWCESLCGETDAARQHAQLGLRLSPRDTEIWLGIAYLALAQASFADGDYRECEKWARLSIQMHPRAPIRQALMSACLVWNGDRDAAKRHLRELSTFAPDFIPGVLGGEFELFSTSDDNVRFIEALRSAVSGPE
ncbi:BTAD domain-containing putative transcriptional regulator [Nioella aestuarii]|uniref:BTAD domain-containing putative transcriptional regulator n=1 Tax=Nioella aestuarii TaxID=1662864 RepID=UPI003D7F6536